MQGGGGEPGGEGISGLGEVRGLAERERGMRV
jgi:hypothetical protein